MIATVVEQVCQELSASCARLEGVAAPSGKARDIARFIGRLGRRLRRPPRIALLGDFNSGKSTLANALIGREVLPTSIHANTRVPLLVHYAERPLLVLECRDGQRHRFDDAAVDLLRSHGARMLHAGLPVAALKSFELIDTPGFASGVIRPDEHVIEACRRANIVIWCTASTQAWKASEQEVWHNLPPRLRKQSLMVATLIDRLNTERDRERLAARLEAETAGKFAGISFLAAIDAEEIRRNPDASDYAERWKDCGGEQLETQIADALAREMTTREIAARRVLARAASRLVQVDATPANEVWNEL